MTSHTSIDSNKYEFFFYEIRFFERTQAKKKPMKQAQHWIFGLLVIIVITLSALLVTTNTGGATGDKITITNVEDANGFGGDVLNQTLTLKTTIEGLVKAQDNALLPATSKDIVDTPITGYDPSLSGTITETDSIVTAISKLTNMGFDISILQNGSVSINVASMQATNLTPGMTLRADASKQIMSDMIHLSDCSFTPLMNPVLENLNMSGNSIQHIKEYEMDTNTSPSVPDSGKLIVYTNNSKLMYKDDSNVDYEVATNIDLLNYLSNLGGTMNGTLDMNNNAILEPSELQFANTSLPGTALTDSVLLYGNANKLRYKDDTDISYQVATTQDITDALAGYLPLTGGTVGPLTLTGNINMNNNTFTNLANIDMNQNSLLNVGTIEPGDSNIRIGIGTNPNLTKTIQIGNGNQITNVPNDESVIVGHEVFGAACMRSVIFGNKSACIGNNSCIMGYNASSQNDANIVIGHDSAATAQSTESVIVGSNSSAAVPRAHCIGNGITNMEAGTLLLEAGANIRCHVNNTTDMGTSTERFKDGYFAGTMHCANIASTTPVTFVGYSDGQFTFNFTAGGPAQLIVTPGFVEVMDPSNSFEANGATGAVQYKGNITRFFEIRMLPSVSGDVGSSEVIGWASKNGSLDPYTPRVMNIFQVSPVGFHPLVPFETSNIYELSTDDTVQFAARLNVTGSITVAHLSVQIIPLA